MALAGKGAWEFRVLELHTHTLTHSQGTGETGVGKVQEIGREASRTWLCEGGPVNASQHFRCSSSLPWRLILLTVHCLCGRGKGAGDKGKEMRKGKERKQMPRLSEDRAVRMPP